MSQIPNYVRLTINKLRGTMTEKAALHFLKKKGFACEKFETFLWRLGSIKNAEKNTKELRQLLLRMAEDQLKEDKRYWQRYLKKYPSRTKMVHNQIEAVERLYEESMEFVRIWRTSFVSIINYLKLLKEVNYIRDIIAKKGDKLFIVEVKSKTKHRVAPLGKHQKKGLVGAYDSRLTPMLLVVPIDISIKIGEPKITVIKSKP